MATSAAGHVVLLLAALSIFSVHCGHDSDEACAGDAQCASYCASSVCAGGDDVDYAACTDNGKKSPFCYCLCRSQS